MKKKAYQILPSYDPKVIKFNIPSQPFWVLVKNNENGEPDKLVGYNRNWVQVEEELNSLYIELSAQLESAKAEIASLKEEIALLKNKKKSKR